MMEPQQQQHVKAQFAAAVLLGQVVLNGPILLGHVLVELHTAANTMQE
jgi:hypothetical protein